MQSNFWAGTKYLTQNILGPVKGQGISLYTTYYLKLDDKVRLDREQSGNSEAFPVTNFPVYFLNSEQPGVS